MIYFYSFYHIEKNTNPASDFTTGYVNGGSWGGAIVQGIFCAHGNYIQGDFGSQTSIIITSMVNLVLVITPQDI